MKYLLAISLLLCLISLDIRSFAQSKKRVCESPAVIFRKFQAGSLNIFAGLGTARNRVNSKNYFNYNTELRINYFPKNYLEFGVGLKPSIVNNSASENTLLFENNVYFRYYPFSIACYKTALLTGLNIVRDGSSFSVKGEPISNNKVYSSCTIGLIFVPKPWLNLETFTDIFPNRPARYNFGLFCNIKTFKLR